MQIFNSKGTGCQRHVDFSKILLNEYYMFTKSISSWQKQLFRQIFILQLENLEWSRNTRARRKARKYGCPHVT